MTISQQFLVSPPAWLRLVSGSQMPWAWGCAERQRELAGWLQVMALASPGYMCVPWDRLQGCGLQGLWLIGQGGMLSVFFSFPQVRELGFAAQATKLGVFICALGLPGPSSLGSGKTHQNTCVLAER